MKGLTVGVERVLNQLTLAEKVKEPHSRYDSRCRVDFACERV